MKHLIITLLLLMSFQSVGGIDWNRLEFQFYPCSVEDEFIDLKRAKIIKWEDDDNLIVLQYNEKQYTWKNKNTLYRGKKILECYFLLCIVWKNGFDIIADSTNFKG